MPLIFAAYVGKSEPLRNVQVQLQIPEYKETPVFTQKERECVRDMVYGEAGSEPFEGKVAAASVAIFRSLESNWMGDLCKVVREPSQFYGYKHQPKDTPWLKESMRSVDYAIAHISELRVVYYFHRKEIKGNYAYQFQIGNHTFYRRGGNVLRARSISSDSFLSAVQKQSYRGHSTARSSVRNAAVARMY